MTDLAIVNSADATLEQLEAVIDANLTGALAVATSLSVIHDRKLYKATHPTWETYCLERWQMSRSAAWRQIGQVKAQAELPAGAPKPPQEPAEKRAKRRRTQNVADIPGSVPLTSDDGSSVRDEMNPADPPDEPVEKVRVVIGSGVSSAEAFQLLRIAELESEIVRMKNVLGTLANRRDSLPEWARDMLAPWVIVGMTVKKKAGGFDVKKGAAVGRGPAPRNPPPPARALTSPRAVKEQKEAGIIFPASTRVFAKDPKDCSHNFRQRNGFCPSCGDQR